MDQSRHRPTRCRLIPVLLRAGVYSARADGPYQDIQLRLSRGQCLLFELPEKGLPPNQLLPTGDPTDLTRLAARTLNQHAPFVAQHKLNREQRDAEVQEVS